MLVCFVVLPDEQGQHASLLQKWIEVLRKRYKLAESIEFTHTAVSLSDSSTEADALSNFCKDHKPAVIIFCGGQLSFYFLATRFQSMFNRSVVDYEKKSVLHEANGTHRSIHRDNLYCFTDTSITLVAGISVSQMKQDAETSFSVFMKKLHSAIQLQMLNDTSDSQDTAKRRKLNAPTSYKPTNKITQTARRVEPSLTIDVLLSNLPETDESVELILLDAHVNDNLELEMYCVMLNVDKVHSVCIVLNAVTLDVCMVDTGDNADEMADTITILHPRFFRDKFYYRHMSLKEYMGLASSLKYKLCNKSFDAVSSILLTLKLVYCNVLKLSKSVFTTCALFKPFPSDRRSCCDLEFHLPLEEFRKTCITHNAVESYVTSTQILLKQLRWCYIFILYHEQKNECIIFLRKDATLMVFVLNETTLRHAKNSTEIQGCWRVFFEKLESKFHMYDADVVVFNNYSLYCALRSVKCQYVTTDTLDRRQHSTANTQTIIGRITVDAYTYFLQNDDYKTKLNVMLVDGKLWPHKYNLDDNESLVATFFNPILETISNAHVVENTLSLACIAGFYRPTDMSYTTPTKLVHAALTAYQLRLEDTKLFIPPYWYCKQRHDKVSSEASLQEIPETGTVADDHEEDAKEEDSNADIRNIRSEDGLKGGLVIGTNVEGIRQNLVTFVDFKGAYPAITYDYNIGVINYYPEGYDINRRVRRCVIPLFMQHLIQQRMSAKETSNTHLEWSLKTLSVCTSGIVYRSWPFVGQKITACGRQHMRLTIAEFEKRDFVAIYGHTDSVAFMHKRDLTHDAFMENVHEALNDTREQIEEYIRVFNETQKRKIPSPLTHLVIQHVFTRFMVLTSASWVGYTENEQVVSSGTALNQIGTPKVCYTILENVFQVLLKNDDTLYMKETAACLLRELRTLMKTCQQFSVEQPLENFLFHYTIEEPVKLIVMSTTNTPKTMLQLMSQLRTPYFLSYPGVVEGLALQYQDKLVIAPVSQAVEWMENQHAHLEMYTYMEVIQNDVMRCMSRFTAETCLEGVAYNARRGIKYCKLKQLNNAYAFFCLNCRKKLGTEEIKLEICACPK